MELHHKPSRSDLSRSSTIVALAKEAAGDEAKKALGRAIRALVEEGRDDLIDTITRNIESKDLAKTVRQIAEASASRLRVVRNGIEMLVSLFVIPVIASFSDEIPGSQFDAVMRRLLTGTILKDAIDIDELDVREWLVVPELFELDDLKDLPLSAIRQGGLAIAAHVGGRGEHGGFEHHETSMRRATTFVRYIIGQRAAFDEHTSPRRMECVQLEQATRIMFERQLGMSPKIEAFYDGEFFEGLYDGMWRYQDIRVGQVTEKARCDVGRRGALAAALGIEGDELRHRIRLAFFNEKARCKGEGYRLSGRPGDRATKSVERVTERLVRAGVAKVSSTIDFDPLASGTLAKRTRRGQFSSDVPI